MNVLSGVGSAALDILRKVVVDPIRRGIIRERRWPAGLRPIVIIAYVAAGAALAIILLGGVLRVALGLEHEPIPAPLAAIPLLLVAITMTLLWAGALHASAWARWPVAVVTAMFAASLATESGDWSTPTVTALVLVAGLLLWTALRGGRGMRWWDAVAGFVVVGSAAAVGVLAADSAADGARVADFLGYAITMLVLFALPTFLAAGFGVAEVAVSAAAYTLSSVSARLGRVAVVVVLVATILWRAWDLVDYAGVVTAAPGSAVAELLGSLVLVAAVGGLWWWIARIRGSAPADVRGLASGLATSALPLAALAVAPLLAMGALLLVRTTASHLGAGPDVADALAVAAAALGGGATVFGWFVVIGVALVVLGIVAARRPRGLAEASVVVGAALVAVGLPAWFGASIGAIAQRLAAIATVIAFCLIVWLLARRRLDAQRTAALAALLLAAAFYQHREVIADPIGLLLGSAVLGTIVFGQIWGLVTGAAATNRDSARYPRASRVLVTLGLALLGLVVLAHGALDPSAAGQQDVAGLSRVGVNVFGTAMFVGAVAILVRTALRGEPIETIAGVRRRDRARG